MQLSLIHSWIVGLKVKRDRNKYKDQTLFFFMAGRCYLLLIVCLYVLYLRVLLGGFRFVSRTVKKKRKYWEVLNWEVDHPQTSGYCIKFLFQIIYLIFPPTVIISRTCTQKRFRCFFLN